VASEVRNLAQRSAAAAKEIKTLIGDSVDKIGRGSKLVGQAGVTMEEVVDSVKRVTDIMSDIAAASAEQSAGIEQVNLSIIEMDGMTQQNAALVEQAAASFQSLQDQAAELQRVVSIFKLSDSEEAAAEAPAPAPAATSTAVATRAVVARPAPPRAAPPRAASPQMKKPAPARKANPASAAKVNEKQAPASAGASSTSKKVAAAAASDEWEEF
jgi:methyl-accepting chemotaxis protein